MRLTVRESLREPDGLVEADHPRHRWFVGIDVAVDQCRARMFEGGSNGGVEFAWPGDLGAKPAACGRPRREIGKVGVPDAELRIAQDHLLPQNLAEGAVVVDEHLDRE